jgi:MSHA biogenesis protein MshJ
MNAQATALSPLRRSLAPWRARWQRQAKRIDALSLRERAILFLSIVAVLAALFETLVLAPLSARATQRSQQQAQQAAEITQLRQEFVAAGAQGDGPASQLARQLDTARADRVRLDDALRNAGSSQSSEALSGLLQRVLAQQPGLVLERLTLLADAPVTTPAVSPGASAPAATTTPTTQTTLPGMRWQGVELQVQGSYRDAQRYLQLLERELPGLRWGEMRLNTTTANQPPRLQAQLFILKVQR